jgi:hypothetical protein
MAAGPLLLPTQESPAALESTADSPGGSSFAKTRNRRSLAPTKGEAGVTTVVEVGVAFGCVAPDAVAVVVGSSAGASVGEVVKVADGVTVRVNDGVTVGVVDGVSVDLALGASDGVVGAVSVGVGERHADRTVTCATGGRDDGGGATPCSHAGRTGVETINVMTPPIVGVTLELLDCGISRGCLSSREAVNPGGCDTWSPSPALCPGNSGVVANRIVGSSH